MGKAKVLLSLVGLALLATALAAPLHAAASSRLVMASYPKYCSAKYTAS